MKAIQIKFIKSNTSGAASFKAWASNVDTMREPYDYAASDNEQQPRAMAQKLADKYDWGKIYGFGQLENGDYVATLGE